MAQPERNIRLTIAYDGTGYVGWQIQPNGLSVQEVLQSALRELTGEPTKVIAAGRTDSGVHAVGQVVNFRTACSIPAEKFPDAIQGKLPADITILDAREVPDEFHATYSAVRKTYRYLIHFGPRPLPFLRNAVWTVRHDLDLSAMRKAAEFILGRHDFRCFETQFPNKATSVRTVERAEWSRLPLWKVWRSSALPEERAGEEPILCLEITADGFLYNMVRAIVGTSVDVGRGRFAAEDVRTMIETGDRSLAGPTAPPQGLYLVSVEYDLDNLRPKSGLRGDR